jgi:hypothetical protein
VTDHDVITAYADLPGWATVQASGAVPPVSAAAVDHAVAAVVAEHSVEELDAAPLALRRGRRRVLVAAGLVAAVTAAVFVLPSALRAPTASAEAASLLTHAADAIHSSDPVARPDQWWKISATSLHLHVGESTGEGSVSSATSVLTAYDYVSYVAVDGSRPTVTEVSPERLVAQISGPVDVTHNPAFLGPGGVETTGLAPNSFPPSWQQPTPSWLASLPRGTAALRDRLYADTAGLGRSADGEAVVYVADLLRSGVVPADLRAALYRVLATIPGVEITSSQARLGTTTGVGLGYHETVDGTRQEIVVDPDNGELVGERSVVIEAVGGVPAGTVLSSTTWTRTLVDQLPASLRRAVVDQNCTASADGGVACSPTVK